jgi:nicotinate-nucleotide adenylyltransferase
MNDLKSLASHARVGILGGSFDPPHLGHQLLALSFCALEELDELWIIPCANHAQKKGLSPFKHRFAMCEYAFRHFKNIRVLDIEEKLPPPNFTITTLRALKDLYPELNLVLALGSDLIKSFSSWHEAAKITDFAQCVIFERENYPLNFVALELKNARIHQGFILPDINSSKLRAWVSSKDNNIYNYIDSLVISYIKNNNIYN